MTTTQPINLLKLLYPRWAMLFGKRVCDFKTSGKIEFCPKYVVYRDIKVNLDTENIFQHYYTDDWEYLDSIPIKAFNDAWYYYHAI